MDYILVVEDDPLIAAHVEVVLHAAGFRSRVAANGQDALAHLNELGAPLFVVTDLQMPVMDGVELAAAIKRDERWCGVPVLALSGAIDSLAPDSVALFSGYLRKPFSDDEFLQTVMQAVPELTAPDH